jgi:hypothetical protein
MPGSVLSEGLLQVSNKGVLPEPKYASPSDPMLARLPGRWRGSPARRNTTFALSALLAKTCGSPGSEQRARETCAQRLPCSVRAL